MRSAQQGGAAVCAAAAIMTVLWVNWSPLALLAAEGAVVAEPQDGARLPERLEALERAVLADPLRPQGTVLARLERLEQRTADRERAADKDVKAAQLVVDDFRKLLEKNQGQVEALAARVKTLEGRGGGGPDDALRELRRDVNAAERLLGELGERVRRLETKK